MSKLYLKENGTYKNYRLKALTLLCPDQNIGPYVLPLDYEGIVTKLKQDGVKAFKGAINSTTPIKYITQLKLTLTPSSLGYTSYTYTITDSVILNNNFNMKIYAKSVATTGTSQYVSGNKVVYAPDNIRCNYTNSSSKTLNIYMRHRTDLTKIYLYITLVCY